MRIKVCQNVRRMPAVLLLFAGLLLSPLACKSPTGGDSPPSSLSGTVRIDGTPQFGYRLTAYTGNLKGSGTITYQWKQGSTPIAAGTDISGETSASYVPVISDIGKYISVTVKRSGSSGSVTSPAVGPVTPQPTVSEVRVNPQPIVFKGHSRQMIAEVIGKNNPPQEVTWEVSGSTNEETHISDTGLLTIAANETATSLTVTATSIYDDSESGDTTVMVMAEPDPPLQDQGTVTVTGLAQVNQTLTANISNLGGEGDITYQWLQCDTTGADGAAIVSATTATYSVTATDEGKYLKVRVSQSGYSGFVTSPATEKVLGAGVTAPTVSAVTVYPLTVSVTKGNPQQFTAVVTGTNNPPQTVMWSVSEGATGTQISDTGLLTVALNESAASLTVTATSTIDSTKTGTATVTVEDLPALSGAVIITGTPQAGLSLTANTNNLHGNGTISYQWKKGSSASAAGTDISGATSASYTVAADDRGAYISVTVSRSDRDGFLTSNAVGPVAAAPAQTGTVDGTITVSNGISNQVISFADTGALSVTTTGSITVTVDGTYQAYRWYVDAVEILGENGSSLKINGSDYSVGKHRILVIVYLNNNIPYSHEIAFTVGS